MLRFSTFVFICLLSIYLLFNIFDEHFINKMEKSEVKDEYTLSQYITLSVDGNLIVSSEMDFITIIYSNNSESKTFEYSSHYQIEKNLKNTWYLIPPLEGYAVTDAAYSLKPGSIREVRVLNYIGEAGTGLYSVNAEPK